MAAKRSLNVDSTGGGNGSARRIYSFAQQEDGGHGGASGVAAAAAAVNANQNPSFSAHPLECNFTGADASSESIDGTPRE